jgi:hypothetical protein
MGYFPSQVQGTKMLASSAMTLLWPDMPISTSHLPPHRCHHSSVASNNDDSTIRCLLLGHHVHFKISKCLEVACYDGNLPRRLVNVKKFDE